MDNNLASCKFLQHVCYSTVFRVGSSVNFDELGWNTQAYANRAKAFGWEAIEIDGHNLTEIDQAYSTALTVNDRPTVIIARTKKGKGVAQVEDVG